MVTIMHDRNGMGFAAFQPVCFPSGDVSFWQQCSKWYTDTSSLRRFCRKTYESKNIRVNYRVLDEYENSILLKRLLSALSLSEQKLSEADNNLRYIKALYSLNFWLNKLLCFPYTLPDYVWQKYFRGPLSFYEKVNNSIVEYLSGNKPF